MQFILKTTVKQPFERVVNDFDEDLFRFLAPPAFLAEVLAYEGSKPGDLVRLSFKGVNAEWESEIISRKETSEELYFVDVGNKLPFPLKSWEHHHRVIKNGAHTIIEDDMRFESQWLMLNPFVYLGIVAGFFPRKRAYQKYFAR